MAKQKNPPAQKAPKPVTDRTARMRTINLAHAIARGTLPPVVGRR